MIRVKCEEYNKLMHLFLDGRLDGEQDRRFKEHLAACERCAEKLTLLETTEKKARSIEPGEPPQEYWSTFSGRVISKIESGGERKSAFGLKKILGGIFSMPPSKLRIAAGVVSVAVVVAVAILYINQRGGDIAPPRMAEQPEKRAVTEIRVEKENGVPEQSSRPVAEPAVREKADNGAVDAEMRGDEDDLTDQAVAAKKMPPEETVPPGEFEGKKEKLTEEEPSGATGDAVDVSAPSAPEPPVAAEEKALEPPVPAEETAHAPAREEERMEKRDARTFAVETTKDKARTQIDGTRGKSSMSRETEALHMPGEKYFDLNETVVPHIGEADTVIPASVLRETVAAWVSYIEVNPSDTLARRGYEQVATGYLLLARLGVPDPDIAEGVKRVEEYVGRTDDPELKNILLEKLQKIHALRKK